MGSVFPTSCFERDILEISKFFFSLLILACFFPLHMSAINTLFVGVPGRGEIDHQGEYMWFKIQPTHWQNLNFSVVVSALSGDVDVFGSETVMRPNKTAYRPGWTSSGNGHFEIPTDEFCSGSQGACSLYLGVLSNTPSSSFTIVVNSQHGVTTLVDGMPQSGYVEYQKYAQYELNLAEGHADVAFTLNPRWGIGYLYIGSETPVTAANAQLKSEYYGAQRVVVRHTHAPFCTNCKIYAAVYGRTHTHFSLTAASTNASMYLQAGQPFRETIDIAGESEYFILYNGRNDVNLTISTTVFSGAVDVYVTTSQKPTPTVNKPSANTYVWKSEFDASGTNQSIEIPKADADFCYRCYYYIAVRARQVSDFNILITNNLLPTLLVDGVAQNDIVNYHSYKYYEYTPSSYTEDVVFAATRRFGDPDMYIATYPNPERSPTKHQWHASSFGSDRKVISHTDANACKASPCKYYVGVWGYSHSHYSILVQTGNSIVQLQMDSPQSGTIDHAGEYAYFKVYVTHAHFNLTVTSTVMTGDVSMYVSRTVERPSSDSYTWGSKDHLNETVIVPESDITANAPTYYYIAVKGELASTFTILATLNPVPVRLNDGEPQNGLVHYHEYTYYTFSVPSNLIDTVITVTPQAGDPDIYVSTKPGHMPTKEDHSHHANTFGRDELLIRGRYLRCNTGEVCTMNIGVYGYTYSRFTITVATQHATVFLRSGQATFDQIFTSGQYSYFLALQPEKKANVSITITPSAGDVTAYASVAPIRQPTAAAHNWTMDANHHIEIMADDPSACTGPCYYYIGVVGNEGSTYSIVYTYNQVPVPLVDGESQNGYVTTKKWKYYSFSTVKSYKDLQITVTPRWGDPDLYVAIAPAIPTLTSHIRHSRSYSADSIQFLHSELCSSCTYNIGVYGYSAAYYSIQAATDGVTVNLQTGIPYSGYIDTAGGYEYFQVYNNKRDVNITFSVTVQSGDVDMFVSNSYPNPNATHHQWPNSQHPGSKYSLSVDNNDPQFCSYCSYYVGVRGSQPSQFTLLISVSDVPSLLINGRQSYGSVSQHKYHYYAISYAQLTNQHINLRLQPYYGKADMYVTTANNGLPTKTNNKWNSTLAFGTDAVTIDTKLSAYDASAWCPQSENPCKLLIGVYGETYSFYSIGSSTEHAPTTLTAGSPVRDSVPQGQYVYFRMLINNRPNANITLRTTTISGSTYMVASTTNQSPKLATNTHTWHGLNKIDIFSGTDANYVSSGTYYIGVYGYSHSEFSIVATLDDQEVTIFSGVPQDGTVEPGEYRYFRFSAQYGDDLSISITPQLGTTDMYISTGEFSTRPTKQNYQWYSSHSQYQVGERKVIDASDPLYCKVKTQPCVFHVGVLGVSESSFTIQGATSQAMTVLPANTKTAGLVKAGQYARYEFFGNASAASQIALYALPCAGETAIYLSTSLVEPTKETGKHDNIGGLDPYRKSFTGTSRAYYIGVYGLKDSSFEITGTVNLGALVPGEDARIVPNGVESTEATVLFTRVEQDDGSKPCFYEVYVAEVSKSGRFDTPCAVRGIGKLMKSIDPQDAKEKKDGRGLAATLSGLTKSTRYRINVVAVFDGKQEVAYNYIEIETRSTDTKGKVLGLTPEELLGILLGSFGFVLIVAAGWFYYKRRNGSRPSLTLAPMMHEEASDLLFHAYTPDEDGDEEAGVQAGKKPKIGLGKKSKGYAKLGEGDDDFEEDEDLEEYEPPVAEE
eukprot:TRINITY_DN722_c0_g1_i4.p1 TRINITY_DN722_c0_g1~~TRINITY_DN722_c0_g1_i4.p1  ORF type:complete len:1719 (-),score=520.26 TRINITY_DN722_c0_g1_i4:115-5271(-)